MRLLHVVPTYLPAVRYGGPIQSVHGLCAALAARGHDVHVFTTNVDGPGDSAVPLGRPVDMDGVNVWYFPSRWLRRLYWSPPMARALKRDVGTFDLAAPAFGLPVADVGGSARGASGGHPLRAVAARNAGEGPDPVTQPHREDRVDDTDRARQSRACRRDSRHVGD